MRPTLVEILCCPVCRTDLALQIKETERVLLRDPPAEVPARFASTLAEAKGSGAREEQIATGVLVCERCKVYYPIHNGVPRLLPYRIGAFDDFVRTNADWIGGALAGYRLPDGKAPPGELRVLRNFSTEWVNYEWSGDTYWATTAEAAYVGMDYCLGLDDHRFAGKLVLEVGIGIGGFAQHVASFGRCDVVGVDLSYAVDSARKLWKGNPALQIVQASVFYLPFKRGIFDAAYSHGVLHHTYNTRLAFNRMVDTLKSGNAMAYIWVYSLGDEKRSLGWMLKYVLEVLTRPVISRLPSALQTVCLLPTLPLYILYQNHVRRRQMGAQYTARYGWNEALHAARDRFTPLYARRHTYEEVAGWFRARDFGALEFLKDIPQPPGVSDHLRHQVGIRGYR